MHRDTIKLKLFHFYIFLYLFFAYVWWVRWGPRHFQTLHIYVVFVYIVLTRWVRLRIGFAVSLVKNRLKSCNVTFIDGFCLVLATKNGMHHVHGLFFMIRILQSHPIPVTINSLKQDPKWRDPLLSPAGHFVGLRERTPFTRRLAAPFSGVYGPQNGSGTIPSMGDPSISNISKQRLEIFGMNIHSNIHSNIPAIFVWKPGGIHGRHGASSRGPPATVPPRWRYGTMMSLKPAALSRLPPGNALEV